MKSTALPEARRHFLLALQIDDLVTRVLQSRGFDYWESGMDMHMGEDMYESFVRYQKWLLAEFDKMVETYGFQIVDASGSVEEVFEELAGSSRSGDRAQRLRLLSGWFGRGFAQAEVGGVFGKLFCFCDEFVDRRLIALFLALHFQKESAAHARLFRQKIRPADKFSHIAAQDRAIAPTAEIILQSF